MGYIGQAPTKVPLTSADITDGTIALADMAANSVDSDQYVDASIDLAHMSSQSVDEDNLHISNSGSNGEFLSKQSGDTGGLTWAAAGGVSVAFSAQLSGIQSNVTGNGAVYSVTGAIWTEIYDVGSAFVNGTYTAQSTGQHLLSGIWSIENVNSGSRTKWELVTSNRNYVIFDGQSESFETAGTGGACMAWSQQCDMDTSDTAYLRVTVSSMSGDTADMPVIGNRFQGFQFI